MNDRRKIEPPPSLKQDFRDAAALLGNGDQAALHAVARLLAENRQLRENAAAAASESHTDSLTGLPNRRRFEEAYSEVVQRMRNGKVEASVILFDLNGFKQINDTYGHAAGDIALGRFAQVVSKNIRRRDMLARLGGDEFVALLIATDKNIDAVTAEIISRLDELQNDPAASRLYINIEEKIIPVRFSMGAATVDPALPLVQVLAQADTAMYADKQARKQKTSHPQPGP